MIHHVVSVHICLIESLPTDLTVMCEVSCVNLHVTTQLTFRCVPFVTQSAGKVVAIVRVQEIVSSRLYIVLIQRDKTYDYLSRCRIV